MAPRIPYLACPLCDCVSTTAEAAADCSQHPLFQEGLPPVMNWLRCAGCSHIFTDGYFDDDASSMLRSKTLPHQQVGHDMERQRYVAARIIEKVLPYQNSGIWLDIGFGNASLITTAKEFGFSAIGVDLRHDNVEQLKALGIDARCEDFTKMSLNSACSVVSMADVLEHMPYPKMGLAGAWRLLAPGGILFVSMPNSDSPIWTTLNHDRSNPYWGEIEHYHNFSRSRLYDLLEEFGFSPLRYGISERYRACMEVIARRRP